MTTITRFMTLAAVALGCLLAGQEAHAQLIYNGYQVYHPPVVVATPAPVPVAAQPAFETLAPPVVTVQRPAVFVPAAPAVVLPRRTVLMPAAPAVGYYAPVPVTSYYAPVPVMAYRPAAVAVAPVPVIVGRPVRVGRGIVGQVKVYVPGQPIRNSLRWATP